MSSRRRGAGPVPVVIGSSSDGAGPVGGSGLRGDCARCVGLCCVVPAFASSADFALDKPAETPCPHLQPDSRCGIHDRLRPSGFAGCTVYDCFGAGQQVTQTIFGGRDWRESPALASSMFAVFPVVRALHELLFYLTAALAMPAAEPVHADLRAALEETERLARSGADTVLAVDVPAQRERVNALLLRASELVRAEVRRPTLQRRGADLVGADLGGADLRGANLRGALLVGAVLRGADLRLADLIGVDLRGADVAGADLRGSLFLTQAQLDSAVGDARTRLSSSLTHPTHWRT